MPVETNTPYNAASKKDASRDDRLQYSNMAEHSLRKELNELALKSCQPQCKAFGDCAKDSGLLVVWSCRGANNTMNECLASFTNPKAFEAYKAKRAGEIAKTPFKPAITLFLLALLLLLPPPTLATDTLATDTLATDTLATDTLSLDLQIDTAIYTLEFTPADAPNLPTIALDFTLRHGLTLGEGCDSPTCTAVFVENALRQKLEGRESNRVEMIEKEMVRRMEERIDEQLAAVAVPYVPQTHNDYAQVPCTPPYCTFECAAIPPTCPALPPLPPPPHTPYCGVYPIVIGLPAAAVVSCVPTKHRHFAPQKSRGAYSFTIAEEAEYKRSYRQSRFAVTTKKSGWDCLRHYEILGSGTAPYFERLEDASEGTLRHLPKESLIKLRSIADGWDSDPSLSEFLYLCEISRLLAYTQQHLTTKAVAQYVLDVALKPSARRILFLGGNEGTDYVRDMLLHGMKEVVRERGGVVVDFVRPPHMYWSDDTGPKEWSNEGLYGLGFTYARWLTAVDDDVDRADIDGRIRAREFDLVVFGSVHRGMPFLDVVGESYGRDEIVFVDGEDEHGWECEMVKAFKDKGFYFMREIPVCEDGM